MANESAKRIAQSNRQILSFLTWGLIVSNALHLSYLFLSWRSISRKGLGAYLVTEAITLFIWWQLKRMGTPRYDQGRLVRPGEPLDQPGLTQYLLDLVYITFATHSLTALVWRRFWWLYALVCLLSLPIPGYACYVVVASFLLPRLRASRGAVDGAAAAAHQPPLSKRQAKFQARYGDGTGQRLRVVKQ